MQIFVKIMISANISLDELKNISFQNFLSKHTGQNIPEESTIRKNYVSEWYNNTINSMRAHVENEKL